MRVKLGVVKKENYEIKEKHYFKLGVVGDGLSCDLLTTENVYKIAKEFEEYEAEISLKQIKDSYGKYKTCLDKIIYLSPL